MTNNPIQDSDRQNDFLGVLAHELRNPLAPLRNGLQIIRLAKNDPTVVEGALDVMDRQLQQMVRLIDGLVDANHINRGEIDLQLEEVDLIKLLPMAVDSVSAAITQKNIQIQSHLPSSSLFVRGDNKRLRQILVNLLDNAVKYSGRDGVIDISLVQNGEKAEVIITDQGIGISPEMLPHIFDMFAKAGRSLEKAQDGLGIGLTTARQLTKLHGGEILAKSQGVGHGSQFVISLPCSSAEKKEGEVRVLVVDDNKDFTDSLAIMLRMMGSEAQTAQDGVEALRIATTFRPQLAFIDIGLPKLNGYDVCRVIREQAWGKDVTIVALTGWGQPEDQVRSMEAGFDHHLVKPVDSAKLERIIHEASRRNVT